MVWEENSAHFSTISPCHIPRIVPLSEYCIKHCHQNQLTPAVQSTVCRIQAVNTESRSLLMISLTKHYNPPSLRSKLHEKFIIQTNSYELF